jgi:hypothetical protein
MEVVRRSEEMGRKREEISLKALGEGSSLVLLGPSLSLSLL